MYVLSSMTVYHFSNGGEHSLLSLIAVVFELIVGYSVDNLHFHLFCDMKCVLRGQWELGP